MPPNHQYKEDKLVHSQFHRIYHGEAPTLLNSMLPPPPPTVRRATRALTSHHTAAVAIPSSNTAGHKRTFLPTASRLWNELPLEIFTIRCLASAPAPRVERDSCSAKEETHIENRNDQYIFLSNFAPRSV